MPFVDKYPIIYITVVIGMSSYGFIRATINRKKKIYGYKAYYIFSTLLVLSSIIPIVNRFKQDNLTSIFLMMTMILSVGICLFRITDLMIDIMFSTRK